MIMCSVHLFGLVLRHNRWSRRRKLALLSDLCPIQVENDWDGNEYSGDTAQKGRSPLDLQRLEHVAREHGKTCTGEGAEKGVGGDGRGSTSIIQTRECRGYKDRIGVKGLTT